MFYVVLAVFGDPGEDFITESKIDELLRHVAERAGERFRDLFNQRTEHAIVRFAPAPSPTVDSAKNNVVELLNLVDLPREWLQAGYMSVEVDNSALKQTLADEMRIVARLRCVQRHRFVDLRLVQVVCNRKVALESIRLSSELVRALKSRKRTIYLVTLYPISPGSTCFFQLLCMISFISQDFVQSTSSFSQMQRQSSMSS